MMMGAHGGGGRLTFLLLPNVNTGKAHPQVIQQMLRGCRTFIIQRTHLSLRTLCLLGVSPVMGKTEKSFQRKPNLPKEKRVSAFCALFHGQDDGTDNFKPRYFPRHLSADNRSGNTSDSNAQEEGLQMHPL